MKMSALRDQLSFAMIALGLLWSSATMAQETRLIDDQTPSPAASIEQMAWLAGEWRGLDDEGNVASEAWQGPLGGVLTGSFIQTMQSNDDTLVADWTEHMVIAPLGNSLAFYKSDFFGEPVESEFYRHRLVAIEGCTAYFHQLTFSCEREGNEVTGLTIVWEVIVEDGGEPEEPMVYRYQKVR